MAVLFEGFRVVLHTVEARKLEHHSPPARKGRYRRIPSIIILNPCSNFLGFTIVSSGSLGVQGFVDDVLGMGCY